MGKEAHVLARFAEGGTWGDDEGRLRFEPPRLIFRGRERRVFEAAALRAVRADGGDLVNGDQARFALGERAAAGWARAILEPKGRLDKLGVKAGQRVAMVNLDDPDFAAELAGRAPPLVSGADLDILFYGADSAAEIAAIGELTPRLAERGALWVVSLKGKLLKVRDVEVMAAARAVGLVDSKVCAFSDTRTALRFTRRR
jgi:hypothetical protein